MNRARRGSTGKESRIWSGWCGNLGSEKNATPDDYSSNPFGFWGKRDGPNGRRRWRWWNLKKTQLNSDLADFKFNQKINNLIDGNGKFVVLLGLHYTHSCILIIFFYFLKLYYIVFVIVKGFSKLSFVLKIKFGGVMSP